MLDKYAVETIGDLQWNFCSAQFGEFLSIKNKQESALILKQEGRITSNDSYFLTHSDSYLRKV